MVSSDVTAEIDSDREVTIHSEMMVVTRMDSDEVISAGFSAVVQRADSVLVDSETLLMAVKVRVMHG